MILYLDTSALVKLYDQEEHRSLVISAVARSERVVTSTIAYAEARATLARKRREGNLDDNRHRQAVTNLNQDWLASTHLEVSEQLSHHAGVLAEKHALRGFDSVHLATAIRFSERYVDLMFLTFDSRLNDAGRAESLAIYEDTTTGGETDG